MKIHGIQLQEGSNVANLTVASGTSFPGSPNDAEMFYRTDSDTSIRGLYVYIGGSWDRIASADAITAPSAASFPSQSNVGDLFYKNSNDSFEGLYVYDGSTWIPAASGSGSTLTVTGDVTGTLTVGSSGALTLASVISATTVGAANQTLSITVNAKGLVTAASSQAIAISATQLTSGVLADSRVQQSNVTQYQAALSLSATQLTSGVLADARVQQSNVTQHQAALTIVETQIADGALLARNAGNETITGSWQFNNPLIVGTPSSGSHATTKDYVDTAIAGLSWKNSVVAASTVNLTLSGTQTIDGISVNVGQRVLVKNQSTASQNGVYVVASGAWTRATDFDQTAPIDEVNSAAVFVQGGTLQADTAWTQVSPVTTVGTDAMTFSQFAGSNTYFAGTGMSLTGNTFNVGTASTARIVVNADDIDLALLGTPVSASFVKLTTDAYGRVSATTQVVVGDITGILSYTGDVSTSGTTATLATVNGNVGQFTAITVNAKGLATAATNLALTGDITGTASGASLATTLATVNGNVGTFNTLTVNAKGLVTAASNTSYQPLDADLTAIAAFSSTGFAVRTATDTWAQRSFTSTGSTITITNPAGIAGNVNLDLPAVGTPVSASFVKITTDTQGRVSATTPVVAGDITALVDATYVNVTGDSMTGKLSIANNGATSQLDLQSTSTAGYTYQRFNDTSAVRKLEVLYIGSTVAGNTYGVAAGNAVINTSSAVNLSFSTADALRMSIDGTTGYVGIGTTATGAATALHVRHGNTNPLMVTRASDVTVNGASGVTIDLGALSGTTPTTSSQVGSVLNNPATSGYLYFTTLTAGSLTEKVRIDTNGNVGIGTTAPTFQLDIQGTGGAPVALTRYNNSASSTSISLLHSRGATVGTNTIVQSGDIFGSIIFGGANGTGYDSGAMIRAEVDGTPGASADMPGRLLFFTTPDGSGTLTERMRIDNTGNVGVGVTPSAWNAGFRAIEFGALGSAVWGAANNIIISANTTYSLAGLWTRTNANPTTAYQQSGGVHLWYADATGTAGATYTPSERMRITSVGQAMIGRSTDSGLGAILQVAGGFDFAGSTVINFLRNTSTTGYASLRFYNDQSTNVRALEIDYSGSAYASTLLGNGPSGESASIATTGNYPLALGTNNNAKLILTQGNNTIASLSDWNTKAQATFVLANPAVRLGVGYTAADHVELQGFDTANAARNIIVNRYGGKLIVGNVGVDPSGSRTLGLAIDTTGGINLYAGSATSVFGLSVTSGTHITFYSDNGTTRVTGGNISTNGGTTAFNTSSDVRLKENIVDAGSADHVIDAIKIREFDFKTGGHVRFGVVAQELVQVAPEAVTVGDACEEVTEAWGVDYSKLVPLLVKEIQELRARVAALEAS